MQHGLGIVPIWRHQNITYALLTILDVVIPLWVEHVGEAIYLLVIDVCAIGKLPFF